MRVVMRVIKWLVISLIVISFGVIFYIGGSYKCSGMRDYSLELYYCQQSYTQSEIMIAETAQIIMTFTVLFTFVLFLIYIITILYKGKSNLK